MHSEAKQSEMLELEQRKVYWRVMHGEWVSQVKKTPKLPVFRVVFTGKIWGEGETVYLSLGLESSPNPRNLDLMKLRFLMSHCRKNSVRDKMIGKKWTYSDTERSTLCRVQAITEGYSSGPKMWCGKFLFLWAG